MRFCFTWKFHVKRMCVFKASRFHAVLLTSLVAGLNAYAVSVESGTKFSCTKNDWTFVPANCYIVSNEWRGERNISEELLPCQQWVDDTPHRHTNHGDDRFPEGSQEDAENKCRDPDGEGAPWCYTMDQSKRWQFCDIPHCVGDVNVSPDLCTECQCSFTSDRSQVEVECSPIVCAECPGKVKDDGTCCGECDLTICVVDGQDYSDGDLLPSDNPCHECLCVANGTHVGQACAQMSCDVCHGQREDDGTCCGNCNEGCMVDGTFYENEETFQDGCSHCECVVTEEGPSIQCVGTACSMPLNCHEKLMQMNEGDCCPSCLPGCYDEVTDEIYQDDDLIPRDSPCETCYCREGDYGVYQIECELMKCLPCKGNVEPDGSCCGICHMDGCLYEGLHYNNGDDVPYDDPCVSCICMNDGDESELICYSMDCFCPGRTIDDGTCCGICEPGCFVEDEFYAEGADIPSYDPCVEKACERGEVIVMSMMCEPCVGRWTEDGTCCGNCESGCYKGKKFFEEGSDVPMKNPCEFGFCHLGTIEIVSMACDMCLGRWTDDGTCCGRCEPGCMVDDEFFEEGADIPMKDPCSFGECYKGEVTMYMMGCAPCPGYHQPDGTCCGQCVLPSPEPMTTVGPPRPPSTESTCDPSECPKLTCSKAMQFKTDCCPQCKCKKRREKTKYLPGVVGDDCDGCVCNGTTGKMKCTPPTCPTPGSITCVDPIMNDNCCYSCPNGKTCLVKGKRPVVLKYGEIYRTKKSVCVCAGDGWYPYAFCADVKPNYKPFKEISRYFPKGVFDFGKN